MAPNTNIVISFDTDLMLGSAGFINISTPAMDTPILLSIPGKYVVLLSKTMTIEPPSNLNTQGATYTVNINAGALTDGSNIFQGLNRSTYQFTVVSQIHAMFTLAGSIGDFGAVYPGTGTGKHSPLVLHLASAVSLGPTNITVVKVRPGSVIAITTFSIDHTKSGHGLASLNASLHSLKGKRIEGFALEDVRTSYDLNSILPAPPPPLFLNDTELADNIALAQAEALVVSTAVGVAMGAVVATSVGAAVGGAVAGAAAGAAGGAAGGAASGAAGGAAGGGAGGAAGSSAPQGGNVMGMVGHVQFMNMCSSGDMGVHPETAALSDGMGWANLQMDPPWGSSDSNTSASNNTDGTGVSVGQP